MSGDRRGDWLRAHGESLSTQELAAMKELGIKPGWFELDSRDVLRAYRLGQTRRLTTDWPTFARKLLAAREDGGEKLASP